MKNSYAKTGLWITLVLALSVATYGYIHHKNQFPTTEDAYVQANTVQVAAQISGQVKQIDTENHAQVEKNQPLLEIDPTPYQIEYDRALATLQTIRDEIQAGLSNINAAKAEVRQQQTRLALAKTHLERTQILVKKKIRPTVDEDQAQADFQSNQDGLTAAISKLEAAKQALGAIDQSNAKLRMAQAQVAAAKWRLDNTKVLAPANGIISNFSARTGDTVGQGNALFSIVENNHFWIDAHFKETTLGRLKVGQPVRIKIDMYPKQTFQGEIISISPASGASMALLPAENASGNWVKVTQRFGVRIKINHLSSNYPLRVGASAKVTIDTTTPARKSARA